ncbi:MAG: SDR family oxidoreductase [Spirochaetia bacterium]|nr:SDR family oxidoreductase [Spirochaetia bacterium]
MPHPQTVTALITGSGAGMGRSLALRMAADGHTVFAGVRDMKRAAKDFQGAPSNLIPIQLDVTKPADIKRAVADIIKKAGRIDVLVNNAGFGVYAAAEELSDDDMRRQMETNFFGVVNLTKAVLPIMRQQKTGKIINISSILGRLVVPSGAAYTSSKWALEAYSETLRYEVAPFGIQVSIVEPGLIRTNFKQNTEFPDTTTNPNSPYRHLNLLLKREYKGFATSADDAAERIHRIIGKNRPLPRYRIGRDAVLYNFVRAVLPDFAIDILMKRLVNGAIRRAVREEPV